MKQYVKPSTCEVHVMAQNFLCQTVSPTIPDMYGGGDPLPPSDGL